jgi:hypothetical protein
VTCARCLFLGHSVGSLVAVHGYKAIAPHIPPKNLSRTPFHHSCSISLRPFPHYCSSPGQLLGMVTTSAHVQFAFDTSIAHKHAACSQDEGSHPRSLNQAHVHGTMAGLDCILNTPMTIGGISGCQALENKRICTGAVSQKRNDFNAAT